MSTIKLQARDLVLGDKVRLFEDPYGWATVVNVTDEEVHLFRVYVHVSDVVYTGGLLHYTGHELVKLFRDSSRELEADESTHARMVKPGALK